MVVVDMQSKNTDNNNSDDDNSDGYKRMIMNDDLYSRVHNSKDDSESRDRENSSSSSTIASACDALLLADVNKMIKNPKY